MTKVYRILAYVIAAEVVLQAAAIAFASFGLSNSASGSTPAV